MKKNYLIAIGVSLLTINFTVAQNPSLIADINTIALPLSPDIYENAGTANGLMFFNGNDNHGHGLWRSDGTSGGTEFLTNETAITYGQMSGIEFNNEFYFASLTGGLWKSDGTTAGTALVSSGNITVYQNSPGFFTEVNGIIFFTAFTDSTGTELWKSDGTSEGTVMVKDLYPGVTASYPYGFAPLSNQLVFTATTPTTGNELFISDGSESGTHVIKDIVPGSGSTAFDALVYFDNAVYFMADDGIHGSCLWKTDGTESGTVLIKDFDDTYNIDQGGSTMAVVNGKIIMYAYTQAKGFEPWVSDGTAGGTKLLLDIYNGKNSSNDGYPPSPFYVLNDVAYFPVTASNNNYALWRSDATTAGTWELEDKDAPNRFAAFPNGNFVFPLYIFSNDELWVSDGTPDGTVSINHQFYSRQYLVDFTELNGKIFFTAEDANTGATELCYTDGTESGTQVFPVTTGEDKSSKPTSMIKVKNDAYVFTADDGIHGRELWATNGSSGATLIADIMTGSNSNTYKFCPESINGNVFFSAYDTIINNLSQGLHLWKTDGTSQGTIKLNECSPQFDLKCASLNGILYFINTVGAFSSLSSELWRSDGTENGTYQVKDINPNGNDQAAYPVVLNNEIYFSANNGINGPELWKTNGTSDGTVMVKDILTGPGGSNPIYLTVFNGKIFFFTASDLAGPGLWISDGTESGTVFLSEAYPTYVSSPNPPIFYATAGNELYYLGSTATYGYELWKTDGTSTGTQLVKDIKPGSQGSDLLWLTGVGNTVYFIIITSQGGTQLWKSDGTEEGTVKVIGFPPEQNVVVKELTNVNGVLYLVLQNYALGSQDLFRTDGTTCHTQQLDLYSGGDDKTDILLADSNTLFLSLNSEPFAIELWRYETSPIPTIEVCNGFDDDCDGLIDEDGMSVSISTDDPLVLCEGDPITLTASGDNIATYQWYKNGSPVQGATNNSFTAFYGKTYYVVAGGNGGCIDTSNVITVQRKARPHAMITVLNNGNLDLCLGAVELQSNSGNDLTWQWLLNGEPIAGATDQNYTPVVPGNYRVKVFKSNGCGSSSQKVVVTSSCRETELYEPLLMLYPNPTAGELSVDLSTPGFLNVPAFITIMDVFGRVILSEEHSITGEQTDFSFHLDASVSNGLYFLKIETASEWWQQYFVLQR